MSLQNDFQLGKWRVKPNSNEVFARGERRKLEHIVMQLLVFFAKNSARDLPKEEILRGVWCDGVHNEEVLTVAVSSLRKALDDNPQSPAYSKTLHRYGYRMLKQPQMHKTGIIRKRNALSILVQRVGLKFAVICCIIVLFLLLLLVQVAVELVGGYTVALIAKRSEKKHAAILAIIMALVTVVSMIIAIAIEPLWYR